MKLKPLSEKQRIRRQENEKKFFVFDVESEPAYQGEPINTKFLGAGIFDGKNYTLVRTSEKLLEKLLSDEFAESVIYAHNGSGYDFNYIIEELVRRGVSWRAYKTGPRIFIDFDGRVLLDSMAVLPFSLARAAEFLDIPYRKNKVDENFYREIKKRDWEPYLKNDCLVLWECIHRMRQEISKLGGSLQGTLASTALHLFRSQYLDESLDVQHWSHESEKFARAAYAGGRVEIFKSSIRHGASWDINSSYPYEMTKELPVEFSGLYKSGTGQGLVKAEIKIPNDELIPPLSYKYEGKLYFPTGTLNGWYTSNEVKKCIELYGASCVKIKAFCAYKEKPIFRNYVLDLYEKRLQAKKNKNAAMDLVCKLLMNSLYGKFGTSRDRWQIVSGSSWLNWPWDTKEGRRLLKKRGQFFTTKERTVIKQVYNEEKYIFGIPSSILWAPYIIPTVAATITANARLALYDLLTEYKTKTAYCDTDSVYIEDENFGRNKFRKFLGSELGKVKLEHEIICGEFLQPKCYYLETKNGEVLKAKGLQKSDAKTIKNYLDGKTVETKRMLGIVEQLNNSGYVKATSKIQAKKMFGEHGKRHPDNRAFSVDEINMLY